MAQHTQSKETTFWNLLKDNKIEIPIIQRDYAQGRIGKEYLRKTFIEGLKSALDTDALDTEQKLKLDFVYGTLENGKIYPLDGQQRLTTLWLLHWYIALRSSNLNETNCNILKNFTYETRISSREFCEQLCKPKNWKDYLNLLKEGKDIDNIAGYIKDQYWFSSAWLQDPTISSMLNMLAGTKPADDREDIMDGIEEAFTCSQIGNISTKSCDATEYWNKLTNNNCPIIFYYLPITDMGLTDDLYIKMNARGKQLSNFENLKADLIGYVQKEKSKNKDWENFNDLPFLLDTKWTDLFWKYRFKDEDKKKPSKIDEIFFAFINRFFWNELVLEHIKNSKEKEKLEDNKSYKYFNNSEDNKNFDTTIAYHGLNVYKYKNDNIPFELFEKLIKILGNYIKLNKEVGAENLIKILSCPFDNDTKDTGNQFYFIPQYIYGKEGKKTIFDNDRNEISPITHLTQVQRIVYSAVCKFFYRLDTINEIGITALKQWMRVVWNLVSGLDEKGRPQIRTIDAMLNAIKFINSDKLNCLEVYSSLRAINEIGNTKFKINFEGWNFDLLKNNFEARCLEECIKAEQILRDQARESEFRKLERKYRGSIRFLLLKKDKDSNGFQIDMQNFDNKTKYDIKQDLGFYDNLINYCTSPEQLTEIVYALNKNALITNLLNYKLLEPIHNMLIGNNTVTWSNPTTNGLVAELQKEIENMVDDKIYRLKLRDNSYYFEVPYNRNQTKPIFTNPVAQSSSNL